jgi:hypothetical protein
MQKPEPGDQAWPLAGSPSHDSICSSRAQAFLPLICIPLTTSRMLPDLWRMCMQAPGPEGLEDDVPEWPMPISIALAATLRVLDVSCCAGLSSIDAVRS